MTHITFNAGIMAKITMTPRTFIGENHDAHNDDAQNNNAEYINNNPAKWYEDRFYNEAEIEGAS